MESLFDQIIGALDAGFPYAAIAMAVSIPDICANLRLPSGAKEADGVQKRYKAWYRQNVGEDLYFLSDADCWSLRCGISHLGKFGNKNGPQYERVMFSAGNNSFVQGQTGGALLIDTRNFCSVMIDAARKWLKASSDDPNVQANLARLVQLHPDGLPPYLRGIPVIA